MNEKEFYLKMDEVFDVHSGTTTSTTRVDEFGTWTSLSFLAFIQIADADYGVAVSPRDIDACTTVDDLMQLIVRKL